MTETENGGVSGMVEKVVIVVLAVIALYLFLTALPTFLTLAGVLSGPTSPYAISDALARLFVGFVLLGAMALVEQAAKRIRGES